VKTPGKVQKTKKGVPTFESEKKKVKSFDLNLFSAKIKIFI